MNHTLLQQQFERLGRKPGDLRLLKQLAVELGAALIRGRPEALRAYRVAAASALRECTEAKAENTSAALAALLDVAASAEEALTAERDREEVRAIASRPLHRAALRALTIQAQNTTELAEQLGKHKSQMSDTLRELEASGLICAMEGLGGDKRGKPYRLTLTGATLLDDLPEDEPARAEAGLAESGTDGVKSRSAPKTARQQAEWFDLLDSSFDDMVSAASMPSFAGVRVVSRTVAALFEDRNDPNPTRVTFHYAAYNAPLSGSKSAGRSELTLERSVPAVAQRHLLTPHVSGS